MPKSVQWLGLSAVYTEAERELIAALTVREQTFVHALKAMTDGSIQDLAPDSDLGSAGARTSPEALRRSMTAGKRDSEPHQTEAQSARLATSTVYTKPEDIEFGAPPKQKRKRPIYALVWTWKAHKVCKTKARATRSMKAWKRWYERQGWKVVKIEGGYLALKAESRHVCSIHEYDAATHQRLN